MSNNKLSKTTDYLRLADESLKGIFPYTVIAVILANIIPSMAMYLPIIGASIAPLLATFLAFGLAAYSIMLVTQRRLVDIKLLLRGASDFKRVIFLSLIMLVATIIQGQIILAISSILPISFFLVLLLGIFIAAIIEMYFLLAFYIMLDNKELSTRDVVSQSFYVANKVRGELLNFVLFFTIAKYAIIIPLTFISFGSFTSTLILLLISPIIAYYEISKAHLYIHLKDTNVI